ncbi:transglycosylase domain-containing protein [Reichenbachiella agarivorans]|uniref:Transglycosylase domain-containing protein n=1 Tax=Reichenbachiella agarivorans TaxID=2979464 RepID=A0ABY6CTA6_9BACT|nr:transglycosylase domain-containing protein [Reichenbachiella agarivorans]UXP33761.1 transglycosylase domain-containing protein [Reichenbachiella agarivorans]
MNIYKILIYLVWAMVISAFVGGCTVITAIKNDWNGWFGGLPSLQSLERPEADLSSNLYYADGEEIIGSYYRHNRTAVSYNELSQELITTLLVTEDIRFTKHSGIDLRGLLRAASGILTFQFKGGGSTLTMQLAENLYGTSTVNQGSLYSNRKVGQLITKIKEWIIAIQLESSYTKEEILAMYLNTIEYGENAFGIQVASKTFFNKLPSEITYKEAAILVSLINAPTRYNPTRNPENALAKRTEVLYNLHKYDKIDKESYDSLVVSDFGLQFKVADQDQGPAYFKFVVRNDLMKWCEKNGYDLYSDGLRIYTTIDNRIQEYAQQAMKEHMDTLQYIFNRHLQGRMPWIDGDGNEILDFIDMTIKRTPNYKQLVKRYGVGSDSLNYYLNLPKKMTVFSYEGEIDTTFSLVDSLKYYKQFLQAGFMAMEPQTGHIKAWVGGIDHKYFKYDHVKQGKRQPGSTFKPFVYAAAIDLGYSPCFPVVDAPVTWVLEDPANPTWTPQNADGKYTGETMTIRRAMASSVNSITANIMQKISPRAAVDMAHACGIESELDAVPSLCLGAGGDVSLYELVGAYSTFVNQGTWTEPYYITRIEDKNGVVLEDFVPKRREAISEKTAYLMLHMLKGAIEEQGGTGRGLDWSLKENNDIGAKTGTTQNASDGWFMGVTHNLVAGAWVGGDDRYVHFRNWSLGQGARTARPIWEKFMLKVYADPRTGVEKGRFRKPTQPLGVELDCDHYNGVNTQVDSLGVGVDNFQDELENIDF